jgi:hypothetical protein
MLVAASGRVPAFRNAQQVIETPHRYRRLPSARGGQRVHSAALLILGKVRLRRSLSGAAAPNDRGGGERDTRRQRFAQNDYNPIFKRKARPLPTGLPLSRRHGRLAVTLPPERVDPRQPGCGVPVLPAPRSGVHRARSSAPTTPESGGIQRLWKDDAIAEYSKSPLSTGVS